MIYFEHLWLFFVIVFGIIVMPGMDMAYILGSALTGGLRTGLTALSGIVAGGVVHVTMGALGISTLLKLFPTTFNLMLLAGAVYIAWIGWSILKSASTFQLKADEKQRSPQATFRQGIVTSLLNPKAYLFMLAVFPQFFRPEYGSLAVQALVMWVIIAATQISVYGSMVAAAHGVRGWLASNPGLGPIVGRAVGVVLMLAAALTAFDGWRNL
ncbi:MAG TPA: LysE family translocator [Gammaproteobacteria bacterium]|nr:LysE family translocator [Gammaproteobacteria bacterium]